MATLVRALASIGAVGVLFSAACSSTEWVHPYKKKEQLVYDYNKCENQVFNSQMSGPTVTYTPYVQKSMVDQCLKKEGWVQREKRDE
ncbi:MAG: hypothetical protein C4293_17255 [Nitrospiraceae bacterium]